MNALVMPPINPLLTTLRAFSTAFCGSSCDLLKLNMIFSPYDLNVAIHVELLEWSQYKYPAVDNVDTN
jgi:hypothetical protein